MQNSPSACRQISAVLAKASRDDDPCECRYGVPSAGDKVIFAKSRSSRRDAEKGAASAAECWKPFRRRVRRLHLPRDAGAAQTA